MLMYLCIYFSYIYICERLAERETNRMPADSARGTDGSSSAPYGYGYTGGFGGNAFYDDADDFDSSVDYLDYDIKGRPTHERMFGYSGSMFLTGLVAGGVYGAQNGLRSSPSKKFWIKLNSLMNGAGRYGSKCGNNMGMIALIYAFNESMAEQFDVAGQVNLPPATNNAISGAVTGLFFKSTAAPRTALLAGFLGGIGGYGMYYLSEMRSRLRF